MYKPLPENVTIKNSSIHGLGLYAKERIPGEFNLGVTHIKDTRFENDFIRTPLGGFFNHSEKPIEINHGDRIAQLILEKVSVLPLEEIKELETTQRGENGFGSTGI